MHQLLTLRIDRTGFLVVVTIVASAFVLALVVRRRASRSAWALAGAGIGALVGAGLVWLADVRLDLFGVPFSTVTIAWIVATLAGLGAAIATLVTGGWGLRVVALVAVPVFAFTGGVWVNEDFGAYRDLQDALGISPYPALPARYLTHSAGPLEQHLEQDWTPPASMPDEGLVGTVRIPATISRFAARKATVYLPPAALTADPPDLPVIEMFSGQPGSTFDMFALGRTQTVLDAYAAAHHGLAPIVVDPDQLGAPERNPMCVDSPLGDVATYETVDVPSWISTHLAVASDHRSWGVAGFSEGGTCSMQFAAGHPSLYSAVLDISGEERPTIGSSTVSSAFGGSEARYRAAWPHTLLAKNAPFVDTLGVFGVGTDDERYALVEEQMVVWAKEAGMTTRFFPSTGTGHDWNTVRYVLAHGLPLVADHLFAGAS